MSTDKTLADVQPGGMVKLGDSRSTRAATFLRQYLTYLRSSPRQGLRPRWCDVYEALEIAIESLSAQPSLGGQWDLKSRFTEWVKANGYSPATFASGRFMGDGVQIAWEAVQALAAPQPVYLQGCDELRARTEGERAAYMEGLEEGKKIAARQPVGEPKNPDHLRDLADMIDPERQPNTIRKVVDGWSGWATQYPGKMPKLYGAREIAEVNHNPDEEQRLIFLAEQPAQAVDLGKLPRAVELLSNVSRTLVDWAADEQREAIGIVKALIDGKAVGNG